VTIAIFIRRSYMATRFQTYKQINIWCNCEHVSVAVFSCKRWGRSDRQFWSSWFNPRGMWHCFDW